MHAEVIDGHKHRQGTLVVTPSPHFMAVIKSVETNETNDITQDFFLLIQFHCLKIYNLL
jgi:hypothetical protein